MESTTVSAENAKTDASVAARTAAINAAPKAAPKVTKPARTPAPAPVVVPAKGMTAKERAARPVTSTIRDYVVWLNKEVFGGKMTKAQIEAAGISITLYGKYQSSPQRRAARGL
jgi:hypothetical protein